MTDLDAARERHHDCTPDECVCLPQRLYGDDCDAARFRDALDAERIHHADPFSVWQGVCGHLWRKVDAEDCPTCAARALADELAEALKGLEGHLAHDIGCPKSGCHCGLKEHSDAAWAALAKWEASRAK